MAIRITITKADLAQACEEADKDMHRIGVKGTFFERVCAHLGLEEEPISKDCPACTKGEYPHRNCILR